MILTSFTFFLFIAVTFLFYYIIPKKLQWLLLLAASLVFYLHAGVKYSFFILFTTLTTYLGALIIGCISIRQAGVSEKEAGRKFLFNQPETRKKMLLSLVILLNLGILAFLKYENFLIYNILLLVPGGDRFTGHTIHHWLLPLGISFYTFQILGYLIDVYRGLLKPQRNFFKLLLFTAYFPSVSQGPINRYAPLAAELFRPHSFHYENTSFALQRMLWGLFKKLVIADRLAIIVNQVYGSYQDYSGSYILIGIICFAFQLYTDFSGCMDIVIGVSQLFDITMAENFQTPFFSRSISEYWRRWHITLGAWLKDYLFYPLLRSKVLRQLQKKLRPVLGKRTANAITTYLGMFILWFLIGLWHGADWSFVIGTGLLYWFYIVGGELCQPLTQSLIKLLRIRTECFSWRLLQQLRTFLLVCVGLHFFRASNMGTALRMLLQLLTKFDIGSLFERTQLASLGMDITEVLIICLALELLLIVSVIKQKYAIRAVISRQNLIFRWGIWYTLLFIVFIFGMYGPHYNPTDFIYMQF